MPSHRVSDVPPMLAAGPLVLVTGSRTLSGPGGSVEMDLGAYLVIRELMRRPGEVVSAAALVDAAWPDPDMEPAAAECAVKTRVYRAREALERVGVPGGLIRCRRQDGYLLAAGEPKVVRAFSPAQAVILDRLLATHPDRALAAELAA